MSDISLVTCGVSNCRTLASNAAILGTQRFCLVPAQNGIPSPLPLVRFNLCDQHLDDVRSNFKEVHHDVSSNDFSDLAVFV